jgi:hypothetical protein
MVTPPVGGLHGTPPYSPHVSAPHFAAHPTPNGSSDEDLIRGSTLSLRFRTQRGAHDRGIDDGAATATVMDKDFPRSGPPFDPELQEQLNTATNVRGNSASRLNRRTHRVEVTCPAGPRSTSRSSREGHLSTTAPSPSPSPQFRLPLRPSALPARDTSYSSRGPRPSRSPAASERVTLTSPDARPTGRRGPRRRSARSGAIGPRPAASA